MANALDPSKIDQALKDLPGWEVEDQKLTKRYEFGNFKEALSFIVRVGLHADEHEHHPDLFNSYNKVTIQLISHDAGAITEKDVELARTIEHVNWLPKK